MGQTWWQRVKQTQASNVGDETNSSKGIAWHTAGVGRCDTRLLCITGRTRQRPPNVGHRRFAGPGRRQAGPAAVVPASASRSPRPAVVVNPLASNHRQDPTTAALPPPQRASCVMLKVSPWGKRELAELQPCLNRPTYRGGGGFSFNAHFGAGLSRACFHSSYPLAHAGSEGAN